MTKYEQVAEEIKEKINNKIYTERIPSERKIAELYDVSINTVRNALKLLQKEDIIYTKGGSGHYIKHRNLYNLLNFGDDTNMDEFNLESQVLSFEIIRADKLHSELLEISNGDLIYRINRIRSKKGIPQYIENVILPYKLFDDLSEESLQGSLLTYIQEKMQQSIQYNVNQVEAISLNEEQALQLDDVVNAPALLIKTQTYLESGLLVAYYVNIHVNSSFSFIKTLNN